MMSINICFGNSDILCTFPLDYLLFIISIMLVTVEEDDKEVKSDDFTSSWKLFKCGSGDLIS